MTLGGKLNEFGWAPRLPADCSEVGAVEAEGANEDVTELFVDVFFRDERSGTGWLGIVTDDVEEDADVDRVAYNLELVGWS